MLHGIFQIIEKTFGWQKYEGDNWAVKIIRITITFLLVNFAWIFFRMPDISSAGEISVKIFTSVGAPDLSGLEIYTVLILIVSLTTLFFKDIKDEFLPTKFAVLQKTPIRWSVYIILFSMILTLGVLDSGQFIYVNF